MKIYNGFIQTNPLQFPTTLIKISRLLPIDTDEIVFDSSRILYQQKVGSLLFVIIATQPDIAFTILRLSRFNQRPGHKHHKAADRIFHYMFSTQDYNICYGGDV